MMHGNKLTCPTVYKVIKMSFTLPSYNIQCSIYRNTSIIIIQYYKITLTLTSIKKYF